MKKLSLIAAMLLLSACGGGGGSDSAPTPPPGAANPSPVLAFDAFYTMLLGFVGNASDSDDTTDVGAVVATQPEDSEPVPL